MPRLWMCMIILHVWQKMPRVVNKPGFWIWHACLCKDYAKFQIYLVMAPYDSIMPEYASVCLNIAEYSGSSLNMPENAWINCFDYARVLNILRSSYDNIILSNVIILEFFSARFIHVVALQPFYFFEHKQ